MLNARHLLRSWCYAILISVIPMIAIAGDGAEELLSLLQPIQNLSASFQQQSLDKNGQRLQQQEGHFVVQKGGEFLWVVKPPYEQTIVSDGKTLHLFDPDLEQLTIRTLDTKSQMIPLLLFSGNAKEVVRQYQVSHSNSGKKITFHLKPQREGSLFKHLEIVFDGALPQQLVITDNLQQDTRVSFSEVKINTPTNPKQFTFTAPAGVDIIDER